MQIALIAPIVSALLIYWARLAELRTPRNVEKRQVRESVP
jgi:hypothetical protein